MACGAAGPRHVSPARRLFSCSAVVAVAYSVAILATAPATGSLEALPTVQTVILGALETPRTRDKPPRGIDGGGQRTWLALSFCLSGSSEKVESTGASSPICLALGA